MQLLTDFIQPGNVYFRNKVYGPDEILAGINSVAQYLNDNLVSKSPFIYLFATNHVKTVCAYFGIIKAHKICVLMDPKIGRLELAEKLLDTPPAACIRIISETESFDFSKEIEIRKQPWKDGEEDLSDVCTMIYTAADDGYAKAAMLTHENFLADARAGGEICVSANSLTCGFLLLSHLFGFEVGILTPFIAKGSTIIPEENDLIRPRKLISQIKDFYVSHFYSFPAGYYLLCKIPDFCELSKSAIKIVSGGYALKSEIRERILNKFQIQICEGYGLSEAAPVCTLNFSDDPLKVKSIGTPINCCEIRIFDDTNKEVLPKQVGEICIKGSNIMKGYYRHRQATNNVLYDGWLHSGDWGYKDNDGFIYFNGLKKRMINYAGKKVYPAEVERYFKLNADVLEAGVFGAENDLFNQTVNANIKLKNNTNEIREGFIQWCRRNLSGYKIPFKMEFS